MTSNSRRFLHGFPPPLLAVKESKPQGCYPRV